MKWAYAGLRSVLMGTLLGAALLASAATPPDYKRAAPDANPEVATVYRGTLGTAVVQLTISYDTDDPAQLIGQYFVFGGGSNIMVAGEITEDHFYLEESEDGNAISGYWEGKLVIEGNRGFIVGTWSNTDESVKKPFKLERVLRTRSMVKRVS